MAGPDAGQEGEPHLRERLAGREVLVQGHFLQARRDTVDLPDGGRATREYVVHPGAVMVVPLLDDGAGSYRLVLERQFRYPLGRVITEFPAGKLDPGEDWWTCARRELREETGYVAREWAEVSVMHPIPAYSTEFISLWFARGLSLGERNLDQGEFIDVFTASIDEFTGWCLDGRITDGKSLVAAFWLQNWLSGARELSWRSEGAPGAAG